MKIGTIDFGERPLFLAPMEDVTDIGFRKMCKRFGAAMVYTEFVSADAVIRSIKSTLNKIVIDEEERPVGIQIYGKDVEYKSPEEVYKQIEESNAKLTVKGYEVTIGSVEYQTLEVREKIKETKFYVLDKKVLNDGINNFIKTFISNEEYEFYFKNNKFIKLDKDTNINKIKNQYIEVKEEEIKEVAEDELFTFI